ncbi:hypothetical protein ABBQ32_013769 [Trebouxia sp. C0010 RCD-2024]
MNTLHGRRVVHPPTVLGSSGSKLRPAHARCMQTKTFWLPKEMSVRRVARRPSYHIVQASSANQDVKTSDHFKFTNSVSTNSFEVKGNIDKVFRYAADFSHMDRWDPGTTDAKLRESDSRPALKAGDTVSLMTVLFGVKSATVYQVLEVDAPSKVVFFGNSRFHESTDTVTFRQKPNAQEIVVVEYTTDIKLVRWYKWFQPFSGFVMANLAKEAVEGMQKKLQQLQEDGKFMPERSAAAV